MPICKQAECAAQFGHGVGVVGLQDEHCTGVGLERLDKWCVEFVEFGTDKGDALGCVIGLQVCSCRKNRVCSGCGRPDPGILNDAKCARKFKVQGAIADVDKVNGHVGDMPFVECRVIRIPKRLQGFGGDGALWGGNDDWDTRFADFFNLSRCAARVRKWIDMRCLNFRYWRVVASV